MRYQGVSKIKNAQNVCFHELMIKRRKDTLVMARRSKWSV